MQVIYVLYQAEMWITSCSIDHESFIAEIFMRHVVSTLGWLAKGIFIFKKQQWMDFGGAANKNTTVHPIKSSNQYFNFTSNDV